MIQAKTQSPACSKKYIKKAARPLGSSRLFVVVLADPQVARKAVGVPKSDENRAANAQ